MSIVTPFSRQPVADPTALGLDPAAFAGLVERAQRDIDEGRVPSCQLALAREGQILEWVALGEAALESRYVIFSATKALVAGAVWILIGEGSIDPSARVSDVIPEFATNRKEEITIEQVMLHTSGFPRAPLGPPDWADRDLRLEAFARWTTNWKPGTRYEYHPTSAHWVLAELISRAIDGDYREFIRTRITEPLGITGLQLGVPVDEQGNINTLTLTGEAVPSEELMAVLGVPELPVTEVTPEALMSFNTPEARIVGVPGGGAVSTAADLALYYQALLHNPGGIWKPDVLADVKTHVRNTMPDWLGTPANRSLGLVLAGDDGKSSLRGMGKTVSPGTFGHNGAGGQIAWADPATGLSFAYLTNGLDQHVIREARRTTAIASRAANCVPA